MHNQFKEHIIELKINVKYLNFANKTVEINTLKKIFEVGYYEKTFRTVDYNAIQ